MNTKTLAEINYFFNKMNISIDTYLDYFSCRIEPFDYHKFTWRRAGAYYGLDYDVAQIMWDLSNQKRLNAINTYCEIGREMFKLDEKNLNLFTSLMRDRSSFLRSYFNFDFKIIYDDQWEFIDMPYEENRLKPLFDKSVLYTDNENNSGDFYKQSSNHNSKDSILKIDQILEKRFKISDFINIDEYSKSEFAECLKNAKFFSEIDTEDDEFKKKD
jgi:hypothetical protein